MLKFELTPQAATYISQLLAERPLKEAGQVAIYWEQQGNAEMKRLQLEERIRIFKEMAAERKASRKKA